MCSLSTSAERESVSARMPPHQPVPITATSTWFTRCPPDPGCCRSRESGARAPRLADVAPWRYPAPTGGFRWLVACSAEDRAATLQARGGPYPTRIVIGFERGNGIRQRHPRNLRADIDVHVRRQRRRIVERADADEAQRGQPAVFAPDRRATIRAAIDQVRAPAIGGHRHGTGIAREQHDAAGLDQGVDHEGAAGLPLTIAAVAAVHEHRWRGEPIPHCGAGAATLEVVCHAMSPTTQSRAVSGTRQSFCGTPKTSAANRG